MSTRNWQWIILGLGVLSLPLAAGSRASASAPPVKDPSKGEYYTVTEQQHLSQAERDRFCNYMTTHLHDLKSETIALKSRLDSLNVVADTLRNQSVTMSSRTKDVNDATRELRLKAKAMNTYVVKAGDNLRSIASQIYGDPGRWKDIYDANKLAIGPENTPLKAGMRLNIPAKDASKDASKSVSTEVSKAKVMVKTTAKETSKKLVKAEKKVVQPPH
jgi:nucleoid-associated protein YgaU